MNSELQMPLKRWFREGELVWCEIVPPIEAQGEAMIFWPGLVQEAKVASHPTLRPARNGKGNAEQEMGDGTNGGSGDSGAGPSGSTSTSTHEDEPTIVSVYQTTDYKVKLLGVLQEFTCPDKSVIPYLGYVPSIDLLKAMQNVPIAHLTLDAEEVAGFNPWEPLPQPVTEEAKKARFEQAVAPYSFAVEIAKNIAGSWTPTDEWTFKQAVPTDLLLPHQPPPPPPPGATLAEVLASHARAPASGSGLARVTLSDGTRVLPGTEIVNTQIRYQGLWWGAERIWTDDLVRLKASRRQIAPEGSVNIYPPSGPSADTIAALGAMENAPNLRDLGAIDRGVFMLLNGLFVADVRRESGEMKKECRASGMLYELADEGWEDEAAKNGEESAVNGSQQGHGSDVQHDGPPHMEVDSDDEPRTPVELDAGPLFMSEPSRSNPPSPRKPSYHSSSGPQHASSSSIAADVDANAEPSKSLPSSYLSPEATQLSQPPQSITSSNPTQPPLPPPPHGYKFRPILHPGHEVVISLTLISGRYYPSLFSHPCFRPVIVRMQQIAHGMVAPELQHLLSLEGLCPGFYNAVDPVKWVPGRTIMCKDAERDKRRLLWEHWERRAVEEAGGGKARQGDVSPSLRESEAPSVEL